MSESERSGKSKRVESWTPVRAREMIERRPGRVRRRSRRSTTCVRGVFGTGPKQLELQEEDKAPQFVAVTVPVGTKVVHAVEIEIGGLTMRVREGADASFVVKLVSALQRRSVPPC